MWRLEHTNPAPLIITLIIFVVSCRLETHDGDYMFCFDNTFSTVSEKIIFFELILDNMGDDNNDAEDWKQYVHGTDMVDMKLEDIMVRIFQNP